jgi:predicted transglutaminase-like cysteine proteinase
MLAAIQGQRFARHSPKDHGPKYRALAFGLLLGFTLLSPASAEPLADHTSFIVDPGEIDAVSSTGSSSKTAVLEPGPAAKTTPIRVYRPPALFGMETEPIAESTISEKWDHAKAEIGRELEVVAECHRSGACPADAQKLIELSAAGAGRSGRAKVGFINRAVDLAIKPMSDDAQWGEADHWSAPFETLRSSRGDCEDYAIVKYLALLEAGISRDDLRIVILKNVLPHEDHAVVVVRVDDQWLILDNRTLTMVRDIDVRQATPEFVLDQAGAWRFVSGSRNRTLGLRAARSG